MVQKLKEGINKQDIKKLIPTVGNLEMGLTIVKNQINLKELIMTLIKEEKRIKIALESI